MEYEEKKLWEYSLLDKVYFLVNFQKSHTRIVYRGNTGKYTPDRAGSILAFPVLAKLYWEHIFQYWPSTRLWRGSFENSPQGGLLMSPLNFLITRSYKTWPRMGYKGIVHLEYLGATFATHKAGKTLGLSATSVISRQDQARSSVRMNSVRAIVLPKLYWTLHITFISLDIYIYISWSGQHFASFMYSARCRAIWRRKVEALSREVHLIADTMV